MAAEPIPLKVEDVLANAHWLRALAAKLVADPAGADDLVQETWLAALVHPPRKSGPLRPWLARVAGNLALNRRRSERCRSEHAARAGEARLSLAPAEIAGEIEAQRLVADAVLALEEPLRTTIVLRYFRGLDSKQIEATLGVNASTVRWRLAKALEHLRADLDRRSGGRRETWHSALTLVVSRGGASIALKGAAGITGAWIMGTASKVLITACAVAFVAVGVWKWNTSEGAGTQGPAPSASNSVTLASPPHAGGEHPAAPSQVPSSEATRTPVDTAPAAATPSTALLRVRTVSKENGKPLSGVRVIAEPRTARPGASFKFIEGSHATLNECPRSAADGFAEIEVEANMACRVRSAGAVGGTEFVQVDVDAIPAGETRDIVLELRSAMDLVFHGRAVDAASHEPVAGALVTIRSGAIPEEADRKHSTDSDGRFEVLVQSWNHAALTLDAAGYASVLVLPSAAHETPATAFEVELSRPATLRVQILDVAGQPIEGASITARVPSYRLLQPGYFGQLNPDVDADELFHANTGADGIAVLANLPPRAGLELSAARGRELLRREPAALVLQPGEVRELSWRIGSGCRVFGVATESDGRPAAGQEIWLQPARMTRPFFLEMRDSEGRRKATCAANGTYEIVDVPTGSWWLGPADGRGQGGVWRSGLPATFAQVFEIDAGRGEVRIDVRITRDLLIRGRVESSAGQPVAGVIIMSSKVDDQAVLLTRSEPDGSFILGPLVEGNYSLRAGALGLHAGTQLAPSQEAVVRSGTSDVVLRLEAGCSISGRVVDAATGESVAAQLVLAPIPGQAGVQSFVTMPNASVEKGFEIRGLAPALYSLSARTSRGGVGFANRIVLVSGEQRVDVEIRVVPGAVLSVTYDGPLPYGNLQVLCDDVIVFCNGIEKGARLSVPVPAGHSIARMSLHPGEAPFDIGVDLIVGGKKALGFDGAWK